MGILVRALALIGGLAVGFAGYFLMAAEGWPEPFESMLVERIVLGAVIGALGLALIWSAFKPAPRPRKVAAPMATFVSEPDHFAPAGEAAPDLSEPEPAAAETDAAQAALETDVEPVKAHALAPVVVAAPVLASVVEAPPPEHGADLAALLAQGDRLFAEGRLDDALDPYSKALDLAREAHAANPQDPAAARTLAGALKSNADVYDEEGRLDTAIDLYEEALQLNRGLAAQGDAGDKRALSVLLERLGDSREARGHRSRAADLYRESLGIAEGLVQTDPGNALYAEDLSVTKSRLLELEGDSVPA